LVKETEILQNDLTGKYAINNKMTLNLTARYYWSYSDNKVFTLQDNGELSPNSTYILNRNSFNSWNLDFSYSWWFAPEVNLSYTATTLKKAAIMLKKIKHKPKMCLKVI
jgi:hypothetical protein